MHRGGLGWGKTLVNQLFQTCVYTVAVSGGELSRDGLGLGKVFVKPVIP